MKRLSINSRFELFEYAICDTMEKYQAVGTLSEEINFDRSWILASTNFKSFRLTMQEFDRNDYYKSKVITICYEFFWVWDEKVSSLCIIFILFIRCQQPILNLRILILFSQRFVCLFSCLLEKHKQTQFHKKNENY